jgi:hypothetical protein
MCCIDTQLKETGPERDEIDEAKYKMNSAVVELWATLRKKRHSLLEPALYSICARLLC